MKITCDSCGDAFSPDKITSIDSLNLCGKCSGLFESTTLRPDMWQRLAYLVGANHYLLSDSFYDDETGMPYDIEGDEREELYKQYVIPSFKEISNPQDFASHFFSRHLVWDGDFEEIPESWSEALFKICTEVICDESKQDYHVSRAYHMLSLFKQSEEIAVFIEDRWNADHQRCWFGVDRALFKHFTAGKAIEVLKCSLLSLEVDRYFQDYLGSLAIAGSSEAISAYREILAVREVPLLDKLGAYYRAMNPSWSDIKHDILSGRPMSIVALDALWIEHGNQYRKFFERRGIESLSVPSDDCKQILERYLVEDDVARVRSAIERCSIIYNLGI